MKTAAVSRPETSKNYYMLYLTSQHVLNTVRCDGEVTVQLRSEGHAFSLRGRHDSLHGPHQLFLEMRGTASRTLPAQHTHTASEDTGKFI
jgi:hypothetical protein